MIANASGKAASSATPPSTTQVSLPSQIGATEFIMMSRATSLGARRNRMPTPRSNPSISTYMKTPNPKIRFFLGLRTSAHETDHVVDSHRVHDEVDEHINDERDQNVGAAQRRSHGVLGAHQAVDHPRLPPNLGRDPAGDHGDKAERQASLAHAQEPDGVVQSAVPAQPVRQDNDQHHQHSDSDHHAK